jgi:hypothetical protein
MTQTRTPTSGTSNQRAIRPLPHPGCVPFQPRVVKDMLCYIIRHYGAVGFSVIVNRDVANDRVSLLAGDWSGATLDLKDVANPLTLAARKFIGELMPKFLHLMRLIKLPLAQYYFAMPAPGELILVDVRLSINKLSGPGMIRDLFGKLCPTQEVLKVELVNDRVIEAITNDSGSYAGNLIIKPSKMRTLEDDVSFRPLYMEVIREN